MVDSKQPHLQHQPARPRSLIGLKLQDVVASPLQDLEISYRPVELRSIIERVYQERRPITEKEVVWRTSVGEARWFDVKPGSECR